MKLRVYVMLKNSVLDPQGQAITNALSHDFAALANIRQGKIFEISLNETDPEKAYMMAQEMCAKLLVNPIIETYEIELVK